MTRARSKIKDRVYAQLGRMGKAFASPRRLEILDFLSQRPATVEVIANATDLSLANTSAHLQVLRASGLVDASKEGTYVTYRLAGPPIESLLVSFHEAARSQIAEIDRITDEFFEDVEKLEPIDRHDLLRRVRRGEVVLLDVRPREEYEAGHLEGAVSMPIDELARLAKDLPKKKEIVAYCRGSYCVFAAEAVALLKKRGHQAARLEDGVREWRTRGLPTTKLGEAK
jgi:rhodanese-related sulfurtransferase